MSIDEVKDDNLEETPDSLATGEEGTEEPEKMNLQVEVASPSACERHMTVTISREDIDRYFDNAFSEMMPKAAVPGFRQGRAPRKLIEQKFRKEVKDQVKGSLLMDSMAQVSEEQELTAISEPDIDLDAIEIPDEGPMSYEFDLEVRPDFDLPKWKGLQVERAVKDYTAKDIDKRLEGILSRFGQLTPHEGAAETGDYLTVDVKTSHDGKKLASKSECVLRIQPVLSFRDARLEKFDKLMKGVKAGETREAELELTADAPNEELQGQKVSVSIKVLEVKKLELPELTPEFLKEMGGFENEADLRDAIKDDLERQLEYQRHQQAREQIIAALTESANWELPPGLLKRQSDREVQRAVLELRRAGFDEDQIRARENDLRQNSKASTAKALKEHFILERIAEEQEIDAGPADYEAEIGLIAAQSGQSVRRVRAQLEKKGLMDSLRNQIIERKTIDVVLAEAKFKDVPMEEDQEQTAAIDLAAGGAEKDSEIPDATEAPAAAEAEENS